MAHPRATHPEQPIRSAGWAITRLIITLALLAAVLYFALNAWEAWKLWRPTP